jgi:SMI1/KNR4 family protein SUKH-1
VAKSVDDLRTLLFGARDGKAAGDAIMALAKHAQKGDAAAKQALGEYVLKGAVNMRRFACTTLARTVTAADADLAAIFQAGLADASVRAASIKPYLVTAGKVAYPDLTKLVQDKSIPPGDRGYAIKALARFTKQLFDRGIRADASRWKEADLRVAEVEAWAAAGYPDGEGYAPPPRHPALDEPDTPFEKIVSRLDKKLAKRRRRHQDPANPTDWLAVAAPEDLQRIQARWQLPAVYLDFLTRFSPVNVALETRTFIQGLLLFGAQDLIQAQEGYSFNPAEGKPIEEWPAHLLVIASHGADPFVLDLSKSNGEDAPVDTAEHGTGRWEFDRVADSFCKFLQTLAK